MQFLIMKTNTILILIAFVVLPCSAWWFGNDPRVEPHEGMFVILLIYIWLKQNVFKITVRFITKL